MYREHLEDIIDHAKNPRGIEKKLQEKGFRAKQIKDIAKAFGIKDGDITKLNPKAVKYITSMVKDLKMSNLSDPDDNIYYDRNQKYDLSGVKNFLTGGTKKYFIAAATKLQELDYKTKGKAKKQ